jgi:uncharacterized protein YecT (DUF1311 family)
MGETETRRLSSYGSVGGSSRQLQRTQRAWNQGGARRRAQGSRERSQESGDSSRKSEVRGQKSDKRQLWADLLRITSNK